MHVWTVAFGLLVDASRSLTHRDDDWRARRSIEQNHQQQRRHRKYGCIADDSDTAGSRVAKEYSTDPAQSQAAADDQQQPDRPSEAASAKAGAANNAPSAKNTSQARMSRAYVSARRRHHGRQPGLTRTVRIVP
jgi:hypothetical protein